MNPFIRKRILQKTIGLSLFLAITLIMMIFSLALARTAVMPWQPGADAPGAQLIYASSTAADVQRVTGRAPDDIVQTEQMYPIIENHYYYDDSGSGAATVFVFENGFLMGMHYKSANNQFMDMSYMLQNNGDRTLTAPYLAGYRGYYPLFPFYSMY